MSPFRLDAALAGKLVITRDGRRVGQLTYFEASNELWPVVGVVDGLVQLFSLQGKSGENHQAMPLDLFMQDLSFPVTFYIN